jgi:hypothetical protein
MEEKEEFILHFKSGKYTVSALGQMFEISRPTAYKFIHRYESAGLPGLLELSGNGNLNYPGCGKQNSPTRMKKKSSSYKVVDTTPTTRMNSNDTYECISNYTETQEAGHGNSGNQPPAGDSP